MSGCCLISLTSGQTLGHSSFLFSLTHTHRHTRYSHSPVWQLERCADASARACRATPPPSRRGTASWTSQRNACYSRSRHSTTSVRAGWTAAPHSHTLTAASPWRMRGTPASSYRPPWWHERTLLPWNLKINKTYKNSKFVHHILKYDSEL